MTSPPSSSDDRDDWVRVGLPSGEIVYARVVPPRALEHQRPSPPLPAEEAVRTWRDRLRSLPERAAKRVYRKATSVYAKLRSRLPF